MALRARYHYIKANAFRVVHVDGVIGGPTPSGNVQVSVFSERAPLPTLAEHEVTDLGDGGFKVGRQISSEGKDGFVREVEVAMMMNLTMTKRLHRWLGQQIKLLGEEPMPLDEPAPEADSTDGAEPPEVVPAKGPANA